MQPIALSPCEFLAICLGSSLYLLVEHLRNILSHIHLFIELTVQQSSLLWINPCLMGDRTSSKCSLLFCFGLTGLKGSPHGSSEDPSETQKQLPVGGPSLIMHLCIDSLSLPPPPKPHTLLLLLISVCPP